MYSVKPGLVNTNPGLIRLHTCATFLKKKNVNIKKYLN